MNKRAAELYLNKLFGTHTGYVAVAYKDKGNSWQESQFAWPAGRAKLLGWAEVHQDANLFICPALRQDAHTRKKGDGKALRWLWADVDWQIVPTDRRADVQARIKELGSLVIRSGSGENVHVYVELSREVSREEFAKLNTGLKDYLYADSKQADNSFLRLPGTTNWKTPDGSPVEVFDKRDGTIAPAALMKRRAFRDAKVPLEADSIEWEFVDIEPSGRLKRLVNMTVEEAEGRYGKRHKAVRATVNELKKKYGLDPDQIHTLMDRFPAGLDKMAEENGYNLHEDIDRCLIAIQAVEDVASDLTEDEQEEIVEGLDFEEATDQNIEEAFTADVRREAERIRLRREASKLAQAIEAERAWRSPPDDTSSSLSDLLKNPPSPAQYLIDDMCSAEGFVVIVGQYKTGKTKLMVNSLLTALADNEPFLGEKAVHVPEEGAVCGHWNLEMSALDLVDKYMRSAEFKNPHNVHLANWQGYGVNLLTDLGKQMAIDWLTTRRVKIWTIDSWTALCRSAGVDPNDGGQVGALAQAIIDIKVQAGVQAVFLLAHISRSSQESDRPGTKGAVDLDAIVDTRWMYTVDKSDVRFIQVEGRGTTMPATSTDFDEVTGRSKLGTVGRGSAAAAGWVQLVMSVVNLYPSGINASSLCNKLYEKGHPKNKTKAMEHIEEAVEANMIRREKAPPTGRGGRPAVVHFPVGSGKVEGDRARQATSREVNLASVDMRPRTRRRADV